METLKEDLEIRDKTSRLDHEWVQVLINLRMKYAKSFSGKRHSATAAWDDILKEMHSSGAPKCITRLRIKKKWMNLIAKYKQLKCDANIAKRSAWPYFEQIDRAYSRKLLDSSNSNNFLLDNDLKEPSEKEKFVRTLIDLRYKHRNLFTGKKYAAQKGWRVIQNYLPSGDKYTIDQISKVWQNLIQRYKTLIENESDHSKITWSYFNQLHNIMSQKSKLVESTNTVEFIDQCCPSLNIIDKKLETHQNYSVNATDEKTEVVPFLVDTDEDKNSSEEWEMEISEPVQNIHSPKAIKNEQMCKGATLNDLLNYLKQRDQKRDQQMQQILNVMQDILYQLKHKEDSKI